MKEADLGPVKREKISKQVGKVVEDVLPKIRECMRMYMRQYNWTIYDVSTRAGFDPSYAAKIINGKTNCRIDTLFRLMTVFGMKCSFTVDQHYFEMYSPPAKIKGGEKTKHVDFFDIWDKMPPYDRNAPAPTPVKV